jgi:hypothetical protein
MWLMRNHLVPATSQHPGVNRQLSGAVQALGTLLPLKLFGDLGGFPKNYSAAGHPCLFGEGVSRHLSCK